MGVLDALLEGFVAAPTGPPVSWGGRFDVRDQVSVPVKGGEVVGRVLRASGARPDTHVIIDPGGGAAHIEAEAKRIRLSTPEQHASRERAAQAEAARVQSTGGPSGAGGGGRSGPGSAPGGAVREGVSMLLEAFAPSETPAQSQARGAAQVATAKQQLSAWNASKHPRGRGGKFGYTTGGKRATRSSKASSRTLGVGSSGALVKSIQRQLGIPSDGIYGQGTRQAVSRYQQQLGLQTDGVVGAQTLAALRGHVNARSVKPGSITSRSATVRPHASQRKAKKPSKAAQAKAGQRARYAGGTIV